jgi:hypothetical protein
MSPLLQQCTVTVVLVRTLIQPCVATDSVNRQQIMCPDSPQQTQQSMKLQPITGDKTHTINQQLPHETEKIMQI